MSRMDKQAWARLSPRLDELLELPESERDARLARGAVLRAMGDERDAVEAYRASLAQLEESLGPAASLT